MRITPEIIDCYSPEDDKNVFNEADIAKLKEPEILEGQIPNYIFKVPRRDIDVNNHMNNLHYLDYAMESLPEDVYRNFDCNNFEIMYKNGAKLGDSVSCFYFNNEDAYIVVMKSTEDGRLHAIIKFMKS